MPISAFTQPRQCEIIALMCLRMHETNMLQSCKRGSKERSTSAVCFAVQLKPCVRTYACLHGNVTAWQALLRKTWTAQLQRGRLNSNTLCKLPLPEALGVQTPQLPAPVISASHALWRGLGLGKTGRLSQRDCFVSSAVDLLTSAGGREVREGAFDAAVTSLICVHVHIKDSIFMTSSKCGR